MAEKMERALYSVKMRAAQGGPHEKGGRHISGSERIIDKDSVDAEVVSMLERAKNHQRGEADFISIKVELIRKEQVQYRNLLSFSECPVANVAEGRKVAVEELVRTGVTRKAAEKGLAAIAALPDSMRGAMLVNAVTGERMDNLGNRGVRVTNMDVDDPDEFRQALARRGLKGDHVREALVLASKVAGAGSVVAELCWSDDPLYVTGYVGSPKYGYRRIPILKNLHDGVGGRVFFIKPETDLNALIQYLQEQVIFIKTGGEWSAH
jgi:6-carboxyhexanoate--CoA ligase